MGSEPPDEPEEVRSQETRAHFCTNGVRRPFPTTYCGYCRGAGTDYEPSGEDDAPFLNPFASVPTRKRES